MVSEKKSDLKAIEHAVYLCYGTAGVRREYREKAREVLEMLRREGRVDREEIEKLTGYSGEKFDNFIRPLKGKGENPHGLHLVDNEPNADGNPYWIAFRSFKQQLQSILQDMKYGFEESPMVESSDTPGIYENDGG